MEYQFWQQLKHETWGERYRVWSVIGILTIIILLQTWAVLSLRNHTRVVVVPATLRDSVWLDPKTVSTSYVAEMARFLSMVYLNTTPATQDSHLATLLHYVAPQYHGELKALFWAHGKEAKAREVTSQFIPTAIRVVPHTLSAVVTGEQRIFVGKNQIHEERVTYEIAFEYIAGQLRLIQFQPIQKEDSQ